ncbi:helix-turn-helix transcriptional regulator [Methylocella sp.]|uniref:helix-turn-helix transcriptional regulator n=1 Tax=Methylocella sp. TaxID=1978226 RepID=UPI00378416C4
MAAVISPSLKQTVEATSPYMTTPWAAAYVGLSVGALERYRTHGGGPAFCRVGPKRIVYRKSDLDAWVERGRHASTSVQLEPAEGR